MVLPPLLAFGAWPRLHGSLRAACQGPFTNFRDRLACFLPIFARIGNGNGSGDPQLERQEMA